MSAETTAAAQAPDAALRRLSREECLALLAEHGVGRLALTVRALPHLVPVAYELCNGDIVFHVGDGPEVDAALGDAVVAFSVDDFSDARRSYRVHVTGVARLDVLEPGGALNPSNGSAPEPATGTSRRGACFDSAPACGFVRAGDGPDAGELDAEPAALRLLAWGGVGRTRVVRLRPELVTGEAGPFVAAPRSPYRPAPGL